MRRLPVLTIDGEAVASTMTPSRTVGRDVAVAIAGAVLAVSVMAPVLYRSHTSLRVTQLTIGVVDIAELVREEDERFGASLAGAPEHAREATTQRAASFAKSLDQAIRNLPGQCQCTVVNAAAILAGNAVDLTPIVRERIRP